MSNEDSDLVKLRNAIGDKAGLPPFMHDIAELYSVLEFLRAKGIGAVLWLMKLETPATIVEKHRMTGEARKTVAAATGVPFLKAKDWHQKASQTGKRTKKGEWALTVPNAANEAYARMIELRRELANANEKPEDQIEPKDVIRVFFNRIK